MKSPGQGMTVATFTDPRDGNTYRMVCIGNQCWMAENLKYLPAVCPATTTPDETPCHFVYDYQGSGVSEAKSTAHYRNYGVLYNWPAALAACPPGWHLPGDAEWTALTDFLIRTGRHITASNVGSALKSRFQWERMPEAEATGLAGIRRVVRNLIDGKPEGHGTDAFGFSALPGGRTSYGCFHRIDDLGYWWTSTEASPLRVWVRQMTLGGTVNRWDVSKDYGLSVRCIRD